MDAATLKHRGLRFIAIVKLLKAVGMLIIGFGLLRMFHSGEDLETQVSYFLRFHMHIGPEQPLVVWMLEQFPNVPNGKIIYFSYSSFIAALLFVIEGIGLYKEKRWAEWMTVILTSTFIPVEIYRLIVNAFTRPTPALVLALNLSIVAYLIWVIRQNEQPATAKVHSKGAE